MFHLTQTSSAKHHLAAMALGAGMLVLGTGAYAECVATADGSGIQTQTLYAGQTIVAGTVSVEVVGTDLTVTYNTTDGWELTETHLWVGDDLANMPQTRQGNPQIGNFPYQSGDITGATTYTFSVPLSVLNFLCPADNKDYYVAAHAALRKPDGSGGYQTETGWADGDRFVERGMWGTYFTITLTCECTQPPVGSNCETAFAYAGGTNAAGDDSTTCFLNIDEDSDGIGDFNRWGWTNGAIGDGSYSWAIYAGAGQCDTSKGTLVGTLSVNYSAGTANVTYTTNSPYSMNETHLYVGNEILPRDVNGDYTVAPGQYPTIHEGLNGATTDSYTVTGLSGTVYVVAHGVVCGFPD
jgi:hypothetical protein